MDYPDLYDQIERKIREISTIESFMTSCLQDRKRLLKVILEKVCHSFTEKKFDLNHTINNGHIPI